MTCCMVFNDSAIADNFCIKYLGLKSVRSTHVFKDNYQCSHTWEEFDESESSISSMVYLSKNT